MALMHIEHSTSILIVYRKGSQEAALLAKIRLIMTNIGPDINMDVIFDQQSVRGYDDVYFHYGVSLYHKSFEIIHSVCLSGQFLAYDCLTESATFASNKIIYTNLNYCIITNPNINVPHPFPQGKIMTSVVQETLAHLLFRIHGAFVDDVDATESLQLAPYWWEAAFIDNVDIDVGESQGLESILEINMDGVSDEDMLVSFDQHISIRLRGIALQHLLSFEILGAIFLFHFFDGYEYAFGFVHFHGRSLKILKICRDWSREYVRRQVSTSYLAYNLHIILYSMEHGIAYSELALEVTEFCLCTFHQFKMAAVDISPGGLWDRFPIDSIIGYDVLGRVVRVCGITLASLQEFCLHDSTHDEALTKYMFPSEGFALAGDLAFDTFLVLSTLLFRQLLSMVHLTRFLLMVVEYVASVFHICVWLAVVFFMDCGSQSSRIILSFGRGLKPLLLISDEAVEHR
ncbi:hypothetical protein ACLOJK_041457 [Asimina triloba]